MTKQRHWKDELPLLVGATAVQFGVLRAVDWARKEAPTNELARQLVDRHFYFAPQILIVVMGLLLARLVKTALFERGVDLGSWLRSSVPFFLVGFVVLAGTHADQALALVGSIPGLDAVKDTAKGLSQTPVYDMLRRNTTVRLAFDLVGLLICLLGLRTSAPETSDAAAARAAVRAQDWGRAGELWLKVGDTKKAKHAFKKGRLPLRVAALELRDGHHREAAGIFEEAGDAYAVDAARAWEQAGDAAKAKASYARALAEARAGLKWERVLEIAEATGDQAALAEACRRIGEARPAGLPRTAMFKRSADAYKALGRPAEAAEGYRQAGEYGEAAALFLQAGNQAEAAKDFERAGDLARAADAAGRSGDPRRAMELSARDAEFRGDVVAAAEAWEKLGSLDRAAALFERKGLFDRAARAYRSAGRGEMAAGLFLRSGEPLAAAACFESAGQTEKAAALYRDQKEWAKAADLYRAAGKPAEAAAALQAAGDFVEAAALFQRAGRRLDAARCMLGAGMREKAWEHLMGVPRSEAGLKETFLELAQAHLAAGEARDAVHVLRELLGPAAVDAKNVTVQVALVRALAAAGESADASQRRARILEFDPTWASQLDEVPDFDSALSAPSTVVPMPVGAVHTDETRAVDQQAVPTATPFPTAAIVSPVPAPVSAPQPATAPRPGSGAFGTVSVNSSGSFPTINQPEMRYEVVAELGRGGMGVVHKALDRKLDRYVALKILPWQLQGDEMAKRYFEREAKAIAALTHPNVVALYDFGEGFGSLYLAMEFLVGPNLQSLLKSDPERIRRSWRDWFIQSARGVAAAHAKGILHRDLKPANLMLDEHGSIRILDFGLARPEAESGATSKLIGTPAFFPPELLRGEMPTPSSDVYSLGATFYTLATGRWPYVGDDILVARLEREPDDPRPYAKFLREDEVAVMMKALARHRPERFPDAGELLAALLTLED